MAEKKAQLNELLAKSCKFIVANLNAIEKEMYIFAIKQQKDKCLRACKTLKAVADLLADYPEPDLAYEPRKYPASFTQKVNDAQLMKLVAQMDAVLALVRAKIIPLVRIIKGNRANAKVSSDVIKVNQLLKSYIAGLTTQIGPAQT